MGAHTKWTEQLTAEFKSLAKTMTNAQLSKHFGVSETRVKNLKGNFFLTKPRNQPKRLAKRTGYVIQRVNDYTTRCVRLG